jgi:ribosome-associated translation inhibitor RaiA
MNRILVVVFSDASKAFEGRDALKRLDHDDDDILLHGYAIITRKADGTIVNAEDHHAGFSFLPGTSLRSLIDGLRKPKQVAINAADEPPVPGVDRDEVSVVADFVSEVSQELTPGKFAVVAEIDEEWTPWVNLRMAELGGVVYRCPLFEVKDVVESEDVAAMKAHLVQLKAEHAQARAEHKAKLLEKINQLDTKIQQQLQKAKERRKGAEAKAS